VIRTLAPFTRLCTIVTRSTRAPMSRAVGPLPPAPGRPRDHVFSKRAAGVRGRVCGPGRARLGGIRSGDPPAPIGRGSRPVGDAVPVGRNALVAAIARVYRCLHSEDINRNHGIVDVGVTPPERFLLAAAVRRRPCIGPVGRRSSARRARADRGSPTYDGGAAVSSTTGRLMMPGRRHVGQPVGARVGRDERGAGGCSAACHRGGRCGVGARNGLGGGSGPFSAIFDRVARWPVERPGPRFGRSRRPRTR